MSKDTKTGGESILGVSEIMENKMIWRMLVAEFIGTLLLVFIGCGSIITLNGGDINIVQIGLTFGLVIATIVQTICHISGGHLNPAVTLSFFVTGDVKLIKAILYIVVQCIGAACGAAILRAITPSDKQGNLGITNINSGLEPIQGFIVEAILTFLLLIVIHGVCDSRRKDVKGSAPLAIGLAITSCHLAGIQYTGSSLNPARSFGPAVIMNLWPNHWIYWAGPIVGAVVAGLIYKFVFKYRKGESDSYDF
ncbi:aquaporin AQPAn.G-like isoform X2 [Coccinella septempunctata]|uniref:aquaporin AQPAn.G-like isoform X2 n=1 Tax=Coccinella septempunctata TaxID=41139 RepID=UPI001D081882|nr:aquaporin AQPAn.G-like isoform X2 [Coccinella septempunctata]